MVYAKKLVVLTGAGGTGAVTLEKSAAGLNGRLNTYELPDVSRGGYVLARVGNRGRVIEVGGGGGRGGKVLAGPATGGAQGRGAF